MQSDALHHPAYPKVVSECCRTKLERLTTNTMLICTVRCSLYGDRHVDDRERSRQRHRAILASQIYLIYDGSGDGPCHARHAGTPILSWHIVIVRGLCVRRERYYHDGSIPPMGMILDSSWVKRPSYRPGGWAQDLGSIVCESEQCSEVVVVFLGATRSSGCVGVAR